MSTKLIARGVKQLDQILHDGGHIVRLRTGGFNQRRGRGNQPSLPSPAAHDDHQ